MYYGLVFNWCEMIQQFWEFLLNQVDYNRAVAGNNIFVSILQKVCIRIQEWFCIDCDFLDGIKTNQF